jgi:hypothetical protein
MLDETKPRQSHAENQAIAATRLKYYDLLKKWRKVEPHLDNPRVVDTLVRDFDKYTSVRWGKRFTAGQYPSDREGTTFWMEGHRGRRPRFWKYVKYGACQWLVNFALELAQLVEPNRKWRIITSRKHSTVWDGEDTLFEFNFLAFNIPPQECFDLAYKRELKPGRHTKCGYPEDWTTQGKRLGREIKVRAIQARIAAANSSCEPPEASGCKTPAPPWTGLPMVKIRYSSSIFSPSRFLRKNASTWLTGVS